MNYMCIPRDGRTERDHVGHVMTRKFFGGRPLTNNVLFVCLYSSRLYVRRQFYGYSDRDRDDRHRQACAERRYDSRYRAIFQRRTAPPLRRA